MVQDNDQTVVGQISTHPVFSIVTSLITLRDSSAECEFLCQGLISAYRQIVWTQIRLLLEEQSDPGPHCLLQRRFQ